MASPQTGATATTEGAGTATLEQEAGQVLTALTSFGMSAWKYVTSTVDGAWQLAESFPYVGHATKFAVTGWIVFSVLYFLGIF